MCKRGLQCLAILMLGAIWTSGEAIQLGQIDTFQEGTLTGWGGGAAPTNIPDSGPGGAGDRYLRLTAYYHGGERPGGNLASFNTSQWSGNYLAAGVNLIEVDLRNQGTVDLYMRWVFFDNLGNRFTSTDPFLIAPDNVWRHYAFPLDQPNMTRVSGSGTYSQMITSVNRGMFRHDPGSPSAGGTVVIGGQLGIDNILASAVPEPAGLAACSVAILGLFLRRRK